MDQQKVTIKEFISSLEHYVNEHLSSCFATDIQHHLQRCKAVVAILGEHNLVRTLNPFHIKLEMDLSFIKRQIRLEMENFRATQFNTKIPLLATTYSLIYIELAILADFIESVEGSEDGEPMSFQRAVKLMLAGYPVKLPEWSGFWVAEKGSPEGLESIRVYMKEGFVVKTPHLKFMLRNDWLIAPKGMVDRLTKIAREKKELHNQSLNEQIDS